MYGMGFGTRESGLGIRNSGFGTRDSDSSTFRTNPESRIPASLQYAPMSRSSLAREALAEFFGTFILIVFGVGVVAQVVLSRQTAGNFLSINVAWGLAV